MANDPNRDLLPVKEDCNCKAGKGSNERVDHQILAKLSRCDLEDRFLRLIDEQTQLKKLTNCQEEKIKRLGTKLLRLINEKKNGRKNLENTKETEELNLRIIELEHENYALKDKNTVLKQQLANHSRHILVHRSPVRSNHTSPLMSMRQAAPPVQNEVPYDSAHKISPHETQLQEAEAHIKELNEEIQSLHFKINQLQENLERNTFDYRKTKVSENIELIRLQRFLKQQQIQISTLQEQVKNSEHNQKLLKEELIQAHNENDEALKLISEKQSKIIELCSKLEEKNLSRIEEDELSHRINDLVAERDSLKERSDLLMKAITEKAGDVENINELKRALAEEKHEKEKLEEALAATQNLLYSFKCRDETVGNLKNPKDNMENPPGIMLEKKNENICFLDKNPSDDCEEKCHHPLESSNEETSSTCDSSKDCRLPNCKSAKISFYNPDYENNAQLPDILEEEIETDNTAGVSNTEEEKHYAEKIKLERELEYLREMLRSQTSRCEAQQTEISRLMYELKLNEDKCNDTLKKLDLHLRIFQHLEIRNQQNESNPQNLQRTSNSYIQSTPDIKKKDKTSSSGDKFKIVKTVSQDSDEYDKFGSISRSYESELVKERYNKPVESEPKKRFVEQVFLESSDDENGDEKTFERESFIKKLDELDEGNAMIEPKRKNYDASEIRLRVGNISSSLSKTNINQRRKDSITSASSKSFSDSNFQNPRKNQSLEDKRGEQAIKSKSHLRKSGDTDNSGGVQNVVITIIWFKIDKSGWLWRDNSIKLLFVDFSFLDVKGEEAETPESLAKPENPEEKCYFNFSKSILMTDSRKKSLNSYLSKPDLDLIVFKVVTDSEENNEDDISEDIGVAVITVKQFLEVCSKGPLVIPVKNMKNTREIIGTLSVSIDATPGLIDSKNYY